MPKKINMINKKFGRLTVVKKTNKDKWGQFIYECECSCGNKTNVRGYHLRKGKVKSCGCLHIESITTHGMHGTPTYQTWEGMISRCNNPNNSKFQDYGGRGITVCPKWLFFKSFYKDMGIKPEKLTIDRIDNNKGYYKENCKWSSRLEQIRNQRPNKVNKTGNRGVYWIEHRQRYCVRIMANYKLIHIGYFVNLNDAILAREQAEKKYWKIKND